MNLTAIGVSLFRIVTRQKAFVAILVMLVGMLQDLNADAVAGVRARPHAGMGAPHPPQGEQQQGEQYGWLITPGQPRLRRSCGPPSGQRAQRELHDHGEDVFA